MDELRTSRPPGQQMITQNLVSSANRFEQDRQLNEAEVEDLAAFIDAFCLYDHLTILGKPAEPEAGEGESDFLGLVRDSGIIKIEEFDRDDARRAWRIATAAKLRFAAFLAEQERDMPDDAVERLLGPEAIAAYWDAPERFLHVADSSHDMDLGLERLRSDLVLAGRAEGAPKMRSLDEAALRFVMRTFVYLGYADEYRLPLTLDASRAPVVETLREGAAEFRRQVLERLRQAYGSRPAADLQANRRLSPFAAIVFSRAQPNRRRIVPEMQRLRAELADVRRELQSMEDELFRTDIGQKAAAEKLERALTEIDRRFTTRGHLVSMEETARFALDAAEVVERPSSPKAWTKALLGLPKQALERWLAQRTLLKVHQFRNELPASAALRSAVHELFGDLARYGEPN
jgi:hypothetical protein